MPHRSTDNLMKLIGRMTPSEKRHFKVSVRKNNPDGDVLFLQLFELLDKKGQYDEGLILNKVPKIKKGQLSNIKSNLYRQLLQSLRQQNKSNHDSIYIREQIDYAVILHAKGLYNAALDTLDRVKKIALETGRNHSVLIILELEKNIESLYITGSMYPKAKVLKTQTKDTLRLVSMSHRLSNLSISLYGLYLQYGYVKNERDFDFVTDYFKYNLPEVNVDTLDFYGKLYYYQSHVWYYNMIQDFANNYKYAQRWLDLFQNSKQWQERELTLYIKGLHNVLNALYMAQRHDKFAPIYEQLLQLGEAMSDKMNRDQLSTYKLIEYSHGINQFVLTGEFATGVQYVKRIEEAIAQNEFDWDLNRIILFNYKIASIYFSNDDLDHTILLLNKITNQVYPSFREDIQCFARILNLIAHFELGNTLLVNHQIRSTYRFLSKIQQLDKVLAAILSFVRRIPKIANEDLRAELIKLKKELQKIEHDRYERRAFLYLDIISWIDSKIEDRPVGEIIRRKIESQKTGKNGRLATA